MKKDYEPPKLVVLGTVAGMTLLDMGGPNPDLSLNTGSLP
jgi:hypothetical protein